MMISLRSVILATIAFIIPINTALANELHNAAVSCMKCARLLTFSEIVDSDAGPNIPPESYTRLVIRNELIATEALPNATRDWFYRLFSSTDITFQASLTTETGRFKEVTPLIFRRYESARGKGENFTREFTFDDLQFPLFLVTGDPTSQIAKFVLDIKFNKQPTTDAAGLSVDFLSAALKAISPTSAVVTSLTSDSAEKVATKIDEGIGKFFSESASEKSRFDIDLYNLIPKTLIVSAGRTEDTTLNSPKYVIGKWEISFAPARPSIFSSIECDDATKEACHQDSKKAAFDDAIKRPNAVLAFTLIDKIGNLGTVIGYLKQQDWWASDLVALSQPKPQYGLFCRKIRGAMAEIGLSDVDGKIIAYSVSQSGNVTDAVKAGMVAAPADCKTP